MQSLNIYRDMTTEPSQSADEDRVIRSKVVEQSSKWALIRDSDK